MARRKIDTASVAEAYLALLAERGVEYLFANAGTDFAPIVEAYAKAAHTGLAAPKPLIATHENLAFSMAHGYAVASGRVPAVMVHVSVGTANAICGVFNAARENVPILFTAGRSPLTEEGLPGARDTYIHWAQEMFDQAGMLRELVKWDYELRNGAQLETVVDRALTVATSPPEGPVYLTLPREVLAEGRYFHGIDSWERSLEFCVEELGEDLWLFATDWPHGDSAWPESVEQAADRPRLTESARKKLLGENAMRLCPRLCG